MCLAATRWSIDKEGVEGRLARMLGYGYAHSAWQFVAVALNIIIEGVRELSFPGRSASV